MKTPKLIPFADWAPDAPDLSDSARDVLNAIPAERGAYRSFASFVASGGALPEPPLRSHVHRLEDGSAALYVGTASAIYQWGGSEWVKRSDGHATTRWGFATYGARVFAVNETDGLFVADRDQDFSPIPDAPPARHIRRIGQFLFLGYISGGPSTVRWSALNDPEDWRPSSISQAGGEVMPLDLGSVTGFGDELYPTILQERGATRGVYVGGALKWRFDRLEEKRGCIAEDSIQSIGQRVFLWTQDGPAVWDGQSLTPLGDGRFRRYARQMINNSDPLSIRSTLDRANNAVVWACCSDAGVEGLIWRYGPPDGGGGRAARFSMSDDLALFADAAPAIVSGAADADPIRGSEVVDQLVGVTSAGALGTFSGPPLEAKFATGSFVAQPSAQHLLSEIWPIIDAPVGQIYGTMIGRRQGPGDAVVRLPEYVSNNRGMIPGRSFNRVNAVEIRIPAGVSWTHAQGIETNLTIGGQR